MSKPGPIQIIIPDPCTQHWSAMSPEPMGRRCSLCTKTVVDFTRFSDADLYSFLAAPENAGVCGRYRSDQLHRDILPATAPAKNMFRYAAGVGLLLLALSAGTAAFARAPIAAAYTAAAFQGQPDSLGSKPPVISGTVLDNQKEPIIGAMVQLMRNNKTFTGTTTDEFGRFSITLPDDGPFDIKVSYVGFKDLIQTGLTSKTDLTNLTMTIDPNRREVNIIMGYRVPLVDRKR